MAGGARRRSRRRSRRTAGAQGRTEEEGRAPRQVHHVVERAEAVEPDRGVGRSPGRLPRPRCEGRSQQVAGCRRRSPPRSWTPSRRASPRSASTARDHEPLSSARRHGRRRTSGGARGLCAHGQHPGPPPAAALDLPPDRLPAAAPVPGGGASGHDDGGRQRAPVDRTAGTCRGGHQPRRACPDQSAACGSCPRALPRNPPGLHCRRPSRRGGDVRVQRQAARRPRP